MNSLIFDEKKKEFTILDGSLGKYSFYDVVSSQIVYEDAKYKDKSPMFSRRILVSTLNHSIFIEMKKVYCFNRFVFEEEKRKRHKNRERNHFLNHFQLH